VNFLIMALMFFIPNVWWIHFYQAFAYPKAILVDVTVFLMGLSLVMRKTYRTTPHPLTIVIVWLFFIRVLVSYLHHDSVTMSALNAAIAFAIAVIYFKEETTNLGEYFWLFFTSGLLVVAQCFVINSPLGNVNVLSEYLILLLPLALLYSKGLLGYKKYLARVVVVSWVIVLLIAQSRSAFIGLSLVVLYEIWDRFPKKYFVMFMTVAIAVIVSYTMVYKKGSTSHRMDLYHSAVKMMGDNYRGIGGGQFQYNFVPYQMENEEAPREVEIYSNPHNEFLKWGIEYGVDYLLAAICFWLLLGYYVFSNRSMSRQTTSFFRVSYLVMLPQLIFQFPFENPSSFLILAFLIGRMLQSIYPSYKYSISTLPRLLIIPCVLSLLAIGVMRAKAYWIESNSKDPKELAMGCKLDPTNWRLCFLASMTTIAKGDANEALPIIQQSLKLRPFDYHALRSLAFYYSENGDKRRTCEVINVYKLMMSDTKMFNEFSEKDCKEYPAPFKFENPKQFREAYLKWLNS
jgi:hypothetical protein